MKKNSLFLLGSLLSMVLTGCGARGEAKANVMPVADAKAEVIAQPRSATEKVIAVENEFLGESVLKAGGGPLVASNEKTTWSTAEKGIINQYLYGIDIPYMSIPNEQELEYEADEDIVYRYGGTVTRKLLDTYAKKFSTKTWGVTALLPDADGMYGYYFNYSFETDEGIREVSVVLSALVGDVNDFVYTLDGNGTFVMLMYDPNYYVWPASEVATCVDNYFETDSVVPACDGGVSYYVYHGGTYFEVDCYFAEDPSDDYSDVLMNAGYQYLGIDEYDYECYLSLDSAIVVSYIWLEYYNVLIIYVETYYPEQVPTAISVEQVTKVEVGETVNLNAKLVDENGLEIEGATLYYTLAIIEDEAIRLDPLFGNVSVLEGGKVGKMAAILIEWFGETEDDYIYEVAYVKIDGEIIYTKVTNVADIVSGGDYLIVNEEVGRAINTGLSKVDAENNYLAYDSKEAGIIGSDALFMASVTIYKSQSSFVIGFANGSYMSTTSSSKNELPASETLTASCLFTIAFTANGDCDIVSANGQHLRYNSASNQQRFRLFKSSSYANQKPVQLYYIG